MPTSMHYHTVKDKLSLPFNFDAAARFVSVNDGIGLDVADNAERPTWNQGSRFGDVGDVSAQ